MILLRVLVGQFKSIFARIMSALHFVSLTSEVFFLATKCYTGYKFKKAESETTDIGSNGNNLPLLSSKDLLLLLSFDKKKNVVRSIRQSGEPGAGVGTDKQVRALSGQGF